MLSKRGQWANPTLIGKQAFVNWLFAILAMLMLCLVSAPAHADYKVTSASLTVASPAQGPTGTLYVKPSGTISTTLQFTVSYPTTTNYRSTGVRYTTSSSYGCLDHTNFDTNPPNGTPSVYTQSFTMSAPAAEGNYTAYFIGSSNNGCSGTVSPEYAANAIVVDGTAPVISTATIASNNATNTAYAKVGDTVTLSFTTTDANGVQTPVVTIAGHSASVSGNGTTWTATYAMVSGDTEGTVPFTINVSDRAGNAATQRTTLTSGSSMVFDKTTPVINTATIVSNNTSTSLAKAGNTVTLSFTTTETNPQTPVVTIAGRTAAVSGGPSSWTATQVMAAGDPQGTVAFTINLTDLAGNVATARSATTNGSSVTFDSVAPTIDTATIVSNYAPNTARAKQGSVVTLSFGTTGTAATPLPTVSIAGRSATVTMGGNSSTWTATQTMAVGDPEGTIAFTINVSDAAGNAATQVSATSNGSSVVYDRTAPTGTIACTTPSACNTSNPTNASSVTWTVTFSENVSGDTASNYTLNTSGLTGASITGVTTSSPSTRTVTASTGSGNGTLSLSVSTTSIVDASGNAMTVAPTTSAANTYTIDKTAPSISAATIASNNTTTTVAKAGNIVTLSFTTSESAATPTVTMAGRSATITGGPTAWVASLTMLGTEPNGVIAFTINATDLAGNAATPRTTTTNGSSVTFDSTLPVGTITCLSPVACGSSNPTSASQVQWLLSFSESVTGIVTGSGNTNFGFSGTGTSGVTLANVTANSGTSYTITANTGASGTLGLNLNANLSLIKDSAGNSPVAVTADFTNTYTKSIAPIATIACSSPAVCGTSNPTSLSEVSWTVTFSQIVTGVTAANFDLSGTGTSGTSITGISGSGTSYVVTAHTGVNGTLGLNLTAANVGTITNSFGVSPAAVSATASNTYTIDSGATGECFTDDFTRATLGSNWATTSSSGTFGQPVIVNNRLRLTDNGTKVSTAAHLQRIFPAAGNKVVVEFDYYSYDGSHADGMAVTLSDGSVAPVAGAFGGSLGYAQKAATGVSGSDCASASGCPGFAGGWIGVGLDEFGNYSAATEGRIGGIGKTPNVVVVRGSGNGLTGYNYHTASAALSGGVDVTGSTAGPGHRYRITIDHTDGVHAYVSVDRDTTALHTSYTNIIAPYDAKAQATQSAVPTNWYLSYTASTGAQANTHEIAALKVCTVRPISQPTLHHVRIVHDGSGSTCAAETVTLKACADATCSSLYLGSVVADLTTTGGTWSNSHVTFTGGQTTVKLTKSTTGSVTLGGTVSSPTPTSSSTIVCYNVNTAGDCALPFTTSSCAFDAVQTTKSAGTPIYTKVAGTAFGIDVLAMSGGNIDTAYTGRVTPQLVAQTGTLDANGCGQTVLANATPTAGPATDNFIDMTATNQGRAKFTFTYGEAAANVRIKITSVANNVTTYACSTDNFAIRPAAFGFTGDATNTATTGTPVVKAGAVFAVSANPISSVSSTSTTAAYRGTPTFTKAYEKVNSGDILGALTGSFDSAAGSNGLVDGTGFSYSEVGAFVMSAYSLYDKTFAAVDSEKDECRKESYIADPQHPMTKQPNEVDENGMVACFFGSNATTFGRFIPDHFDTVITRVGNVPMTCPNGETCPNSFGGFNGVVYGGIPRANLPNSGQPFSVQVIAKRLNATNAPDDGVTKNYDGTRYAKAVTLSAWSALGTTTQANPPSNRAGSGLGTTAVPAASFTNGVATIAAQDYSFGTGAAYSNQAPSATANWIAPTNIFIRALEPKLANGTIDYITTDGVSSLRTTNPTTDSVEAGLRVVSGRMLVPHVFGSELLRVRVPVLAQYWNGSNWVSSYVDDVSTFAPANVLRSNYVRFVTAANALVMNLNQAPTALVRGAGEFFIQATGAGNVGSVDLSLSAPSWLPSTIGRTRVGTYRTPLIYIREIY